MKQYYSKSAYLIVFLLTTLLFFSTKTKAQVMSQDSLALVDFYNSTNGANWIAKNNWLSGNVGTWFGITLKNNRVSKINLPLNNLKGDVIASIQNLDSLLKLNVSNNKVTALPNLSNLSKLDTLLVSQNKLTFRDLQPNFSVASNFVYAPQDSVEVSIDTMVLEQSTFVMRVDIDTQAGISNQYQWYKNGDSIPGATARAFTLLCFDSLQAAKYTCRIKNSVVTGLQLYRYPVRAKFNRLANAGVDVSVCNTFSSLNGNTPTLGNGTWALISGSASITDPDSSLTAVTQLAPGANTFRWTMSNNSLCPASYDYVVITRDLPPSLPNASADMEICIDHVQLSGNTPTIGTGLWTVMSGSGVVLQPSSPNSVVNGLSLGENILRWQIFSGVCPPSIFDELKIFVADTLQTVNAGSDFSLCAISANLSATLPPHTSGIWSLVSGNGLIADNANPTSSVSSMTEGPNVFRWTLNNACNKPIADEVAVTVYNFTYANAGDDGSFYFSPINPLKLASNVSVGTGGTGVYSYNWSPADNLDNSSLEHPSFSAPDLGGYNFSVTVTDGNGCTATDNVNVEITKFEVLEVPKLITPNGDGVNDYLYMPGIESYPNNEFAIYDRTGQLVYKKSGYVNEFGGVSSQGMLRNDSQLPQDTYFYILTLEKGQIQKGYFELKR